jgi:DNA gyrase subunit B/topoisomerase-4 subunit B
MTRSTRHGPVTLDECGVHAAGAPRRPDVPLELFVVEGESAALAVGRVRDAATQAVLPMQGKPLNAAKATAKRVASQPFFAALAAGLGTGWGESCDIARLRYDRLLLLMDPDADGIHCGVLLLTFLHRWIRPLLDAGRVEIVRPPWGEVLPADGPPVRQACSEAELVALADRERERGPVVTRRFRGLAALDPGLLRDSCVSPASRRTETIDTTRAAAMIDLFRTLGDA